MINAYIRENNQMRSYIIIGVYSLLVAAYYKWEASVFVIMASIFLEMILLFIGAIIIGRYSRQKFSDVGRSGAFFALFACMAMLYPLAYMMGDAYGEYSDPIEYSFLQPVVDYKYEIIIMFFSLGVGYLLDFNSLKKKDLAAYLSKEVFRVSFLLFGIGLLGMMCIEFTKELSDHYGPGLINGTVKTPYSNGSKMFTILVLVSARIAIEIWFFLWHGRNKTSA